MKISTKAWREYIEKMSRISRQAADLMQEWVGKHGFGDDKALLDYAYALATHYGEAIGSLSCRMYEAAAEASGKYVPSAEPAETPDYGEVAKAVHGTMKKSNNLVPSTVGRLVKQVGADTTLKNAIRDGAEFAWIPSGDSCAFCITLAANGWQKASKKILKKGHAEHIHANCDCQYAVRFDGKSSVEGYDPQKYLDMYNGADPGGSPKDKINALRRAMREKAKEESERKAMFRMNLQLFAKIPDGKLTGYALNPNASDGGNKAKAFNDALGYNLGNYEELKQKILDNFSEDRLIYKREDQFGKRYEIVMEITGANGKTANADAASMTCPARAYRSRAKQVRYS